MRKKHHDEIDILSVVSLGYSLLLIGVIFAMTPNLPNEIYDFFHDFELREAYPGVSIPAPALDHPVLYSALFHFFLAFAIFQVVILLARFILREPIERKSGTFSGLFLWFGAAAALNSLRAGSIDWFIFVGWLIVLIGAAIVVRSAILFAYREKRYRLS